VAVQDSTAYLSADGAGLLVVDVRVPTSPHLLGTCQFIGLYPRDAVVADGRAFVAGHHGFDVIDVQDPALPLALGRYVTGGSIYGIAAGGGLAATTGGGGVRLWDIADPTRPQRRGLFPADPHCMAIVGTTLYVGDYFDGLRIVDIADPDSLVEVGCYEDLSWPNGIVVRNGRVYVTDRWDGLVVIDIHDPQNPQRLDAIEFPEQPQGLALDGNTAYVAAEAAGLRVVDVSNPGYLTERGFLVMPGYAYGVAIAGDLAYVADGEAGLRVVDVSSPASPQVVGFCSTSGVAYKVAANGATAFVADYDGGLRVIDVSDAAHPHRVGIVRTPDDAVDVVAMGDTVLLSARDAGMLVLRYDNPAGLERPAPARPAGVVLVSVVPNPFNPHTTIHYSLAAPQDVTLRVFDLSGRQVRLLAHGAQAAGEHAFLFDGADLASGIYFYELRTESGSAGGKLLLVK
jgi:hypothetical protein